MTLWTNIYDFEARFVDFEHIKKAAVVSTFTQAGNDAGVAAKIAQKKNVCDRLQVSNISLNERERCERKCELNCIM